MSKVYIVIREVQYEGDSIVAVFSDMNGAMAKVEELSGARCDYRIDDWDVDE